jgi:hypothetical protein
MADVISVVFGAELGEAVKKVSEFVKKSQEGLDGIKTDKAQNNIEKLADQYDKLGKRVDANKQKIIELEATKEKASAEDKKRIEDEIRLRQQLELRFDKESEKLHQKQLDLENLTSKTQTNTGAIEKNVEANVAGAEASVKGAGAMEGLGAAMGGVTAVAGLAAFAMAKITEEIERQRKIVEAAREIYNEINTETNQRIQNLQPAINQIGITSPEGLEKLQKVRNTVAREVGFTKNIDSSIFHAAQVFDINEKNIDTPEVQKEIEAQSQLDSLGVGEGVATALAGSHPTAENYLNKGLQFAGVAQEGGDERQGGEVAALVKHIKSVYDPQGKNGFTDDQILQKTLRFIRGGLDGKTTENFADASVNVEKSFKGEASLNKFATNITDAAAVSKELSTAIHKRPKLTNRLLTKADAISFINNLTNDKDKEAASEILLGDKDYRAFLAGQGSQDENIPSAGTPFLNTQPNQQAVNAEVNAQNAETDTNATETFRKDLAAYQKDVITKNLDKRDLFDRVTNDLIPGTASDNERAEKSLYGTQYITLLRKRDLYEAGSIEYKKYDDAAKELYNSIPALNKDYQYQGFNAGTRSYYDQYKQNTPEEVGARIGYEDDLGHTSPDQDVPNNRAYFRAKNISDPQQVPKQVGPVSTGPPIVYNQQIVNHLFSNATYGVPSVWPNLYGGPVSLRGSHH